MKNILLVASMLLLCGGCVVNNDSNTEVSNQRIFNDANFLNLQTGKTQKSEILSRFGIPDRKETDAKGKEFWEYKGVIKVNDSKNVLILINVSSKRNEEKKVTFVFENDVLAEIIK